MLIPMSFHMLDKTLRFKNKRSSETHGSLPFKSQIPLSMLIQQRIKTISLNQELRVNSSENYLLLTEQLSKVYPLKTRQLLSELWEQCSDHPLLILMMKITCSELLTLKENKRCQSFLLKPHSQSCVLKTKKLQHSQLHQLEKDNQLLSQTLREPLSPKPALIELELKPLRLIM
jgi:hypothetical protein